VGVPLVVSLAVVVSPPLEDVLEPLVPPDVEPVAPPVVVLDALVSVALEPPPVSVVEPSLVASGLPYSSLFALFLETSRSLHFTPAGQISEKCFTPLESNQT
jgi:hypothetical protein